MSPARAARRRRRRGRGARGWRRGGGGGVPGGLQVPGGGGGGRPRCPAPGGAQRGRGRHSERGQVRACPRPLRQPPAPAVLGRARRGGGGRTPRLPAPGRAAVSAPDPSPSPLPASCVLVAPGPRGALRVEGSSGRDCSPGSPRLFGPRTPRLTPPLPPCAPPPPRTPGTAPQGAYPRWPGGGRGELGVPRAGVPRIVSLFPRPKGRLPPAPPHPRAPGTSPGFATPPGPLGQRAPRCETLRFRAGSAGRGDGLQFGGGGGGVSLSPERRRC